MLHGYHDPLCPPSVVIAIEMTAVHADWQLHAHGRTIQSFTSPGADTPATRSAQHETSDRRAWRSLLTFLEEALD